MLKAKLLGATAGAEAALPIEDVFSTYLYTGTGAAQTITNGIDLAGEGGLVWIKARGNVGQSHWLYDSERSSFAAGIRTDSTAAEYNPGTAITSVSSDGFSFGTYSEINTSAVGYASWTFRKAPRFFDVVTYTGASTDVVVNHNLGTTVGTIIVKNTSTTSDWYVWHRSLPQYNFSRLNTTAASSTSAAVFKEVTDTSFTLGGFSGVNADGNTFVAYLFAHDPLGPSGDGSDGLIACGSYTGNGLTTGPVVNLGWEPQWLLVKRTNASGYEWNIFDNMRGIISGANDPGLYANSSAQESSPDGFFDLLPNGFQYRNPAGVGGLNDSGAIVTYIAIRRGPMREPTVGTEVFAVDYGTTPVPTWKSGFPVDLGIYKATGGNDSSFVTRLLGKTRLVANSIAAEAAQTNAAFDYQNGHHSYYDTSLASWYSWMFRRAPGFFDVVAYTGTGASQTINHNLRTAPEMIIVKRRDSANDWIVYHVGNDVDGDGQPWTDYLRLDSNQAGADAAYFVDYQPTSVDFKVSGFGQTGASAGTYIAYLFGSLPGISKLGSYTGNGSSQIINCGFTTGARFVMIKRTDSPSDWYVWDTARGIVSGNDPHLSLNTQAAEVTSDDTIDPDSTGFIVNQVAATNVNVNAASYIFFAVS